MRHRSAKGWLVLSLGLLVAPTPHAAPLPSAQREIQFLLTDMAATDCTFYRNGTWHEAKAASQHLREKYQNLAALNLIATTDDFIERAATKSSLSGQAYQVQCPGAPQVTSHQWLIERLRRFRLSTR